VDLYIRSPIRLHGVVFIYLSTGTTSPFTLSGLFSEGFPSNILHVFLFDSSEFEGDMTVSCYQVRSPRGAQERINVRCCQTTAAVKKAQVGEYGSRER
jgi:hypothetical protein